MKKLVAAAAAVAMVFAMAVSAFAAPSPGTSEIGYADLDVKGATVTKWDANSAAAADMEAKVDEMYASFSDDIKAMGYDNSWMIIEGIYNISNAEDSVGMKAPLFKYGVGEDALVLQMRADGSWSIVPLTWKDGYAYGDFADDAVTFAFLTVIVKNYTTAAVTSGDENIVVSELSDLEYANTKANFDNKKADIDAMIKEKGFDPASMQVVGFYDVSRKDGSKDGTRVTLLVDKAAPEGMKYIVLHQKDDYTWEVLDVTVTEDGKLVIDFPGFSHIVLALVSDPLYQAGNGAGSSTKSPQTGDMGAVAVITAALA